MRIELQTPFSQNERQAEIMRDVIRCKQRHQKLLREEGGMYKWCVVQRRQIPWSPSAGEVFLDSQKDFWSCTSVSLRPKLSAKHSVPVQTQWTYTWPSSWAIVKAVLSPLSSLMLQLLYGSHTVPSSASPEYQQDLFQFSWLRMFIIINTWVYEPISLLKTQLT